MKNITIDFSSPTGKVKPMHAINNAPILGANTDFLHYLSEAKIPYSRLHDTPIRTQLPFVDIECIFPDFDADVESPDSYDFAFTDHLLLALQKQGVKPFYRLGPSIETNQHIKAYHIYPPKDNLKWAKICEHIIAHYNEGWANGFHMGIEYWEIWNEPENMVAIADNLMWKGTFEEYIELYKVTAKHLRARFGNTIKIGGYASSGLYAILDDPEMKIPRYEYMLECFHKFIKAVSEENIPLDFFSWHSYPRRHLMYVFARYVRQTLDSHGLTATESILNEWNMGTHLRGTLQDSSDIAATILMLANEPLDMLMYYDGQIHGSYEGLFNPITLKPFKAFYTLKAYSSLYDLEEMVKVTGTDDTLMCIAARDKENVAVMLTNRGAAETLAIDGVEGECVVYRINEDENLDKPVTVASLAEIEVSQYETVLICAKR